MADQTNTRDDFQYPRLPPSHIRLFSIVKITGSIIHGILSDHLLESAPKYSVISAWGTDSARDTIKIVHSCADPSGS
jgi:hypothetical protein